MVTNLTEEEMSDPQNWDFDSARIVQPTKSPGAVVSVRFTKEDLTKISDAAFERGMKTSEFIRSAALEKAAGDVRRPVIAISAAVDHNGKTAQPSNWQRTHGTGRFRIASQKIGLVLSGETT